MANFNLLEKKIYLQRVIKSLNGKKSHEKNRILENDLNVKHHFEKVVKGLDVDERKAYLLRCLIALDCQNIAYDAIENDCVGTLLENLSQIDKFFADIGGIIGYQHKVLTILTDKTNLDEKLSFHAPCFTDISIDTPLVKNYIQAGIEKLDQLGEIYVVGGAADRLHLLNEKSKQKLPAAMLKFFSKELLIRLIEDVQAKEYLYEKITGKKIITPIALMCSNESDNFHHIKTLIKQHNYFNRPVDSFFYLVQPSVPVVDKDGTWLVDNPGKLLLKPSGHGALWKLAKEKKLFEWFFERDRKKVLIRQINNPIAGVDYGLLAFTGYGLKNDLEFGFASCPRQVNSAEGMNVLIQKKQKEYFEYCITNIEYCEFEKFNLKDRPTKNNEQFSKFSSNTNLLFVDLAKVQKKITKHPYPGVLINFKTIKSKDSRKAVLGGRLETTMQNIAEAFTEKYKNPLEVSCGLLKTFVTYNKRVKTISTTKMVYSSLEASLETPERCFYDFIYNAYDLLKNYCLVKLPKIGSFEDFTSSSPPFLFSYHPALGPIYKLIAKKLKGGALKYHSELVLQIAELFCDNLNLDGSLRIFASDLSSSCFLENVVVENKGLNYALINNFWRGDFSHIEKCDIYLGKNAHLIARDITILNGQTFTVPDNQSVEIVRDGERFFLKETEKRYRISYKFSEESEIIAEKNSLSQL